MEIKILEINRKTGKYEGRDKVPFTNQATVSSRELSEVMTREARPELRYYDTEFRRLTVKFVSGHKFVVDLDKSFFTNQATDMADEVAAKKLVDARIPDGEVFRRAIRDFSKQLPLVYERWHMSEEGKLGMAGHVAQPKTEHALDKRVLPKELL